jgi:perosamine synthetase
VPTDFLPYGRQLLDDDDIAAVVAALRQPLITYGPSVTAFESALAEQVGATYAVAVSSGTAALHCACFAAAIGPGDEVLVPAITFVATANAVRYLGATPIFVDVDPHTGLMDVDHAAHHINPKTKMVIPVHLNGEPVDMNAVSALAARWGLVVLEDAAHALGAHSPRGPIGAAHESHMTAFSFHPLKSITTGEGGAITTRDPALDGRMRTFRNHGLVREKASLEQPDEGPWHRELQHLGHNYRITDLQCALGRSQLRKLDRFIGQRRALATRYDRALEDVDGVRSVSRDLHGHRSACHLYPVRLNEALLGCSRRELAEGLNARGIGTHVHYLPLPEHPLYRTQKQTRQTLPGAMTYYDQILSLPLFPAMTDDDVTRVVEAIKEVIQAGR